MTLKDDLVPVGRIERTILLIRGHRVILDSDLAAFYGVETRRLNEQVKRNSGRFPQDFTFQLTGEEYASLRSQIATLKTEESGILKSQSATSSSRWGGARKLPFVFTEHGALMAASVLNSPKAIEMSILVVRAFVKLRGILAAHRQLADKLNELEQKLSTHDQQIVILFDAIRELMEPPVKPIRRIGFTRE